MTQHLDPQQTLAAILIEHGPLAGDDIAARLAQAGIADPDDVIVDLLDNYACPAGRLPDERWVWLPTLLAGRVFTHRLCAEEIAHDLLLLTPDLDSVAELCQYERYQQLADGTPVEVALPDFDEVLLERRGAPVELLDSGAALLLAPGTLAALGLAAGDLVGLALTDDKLVLQPATATGQASAGDALAGVLSADEPADLDAATWAACAADPALFTTALAPLSEIVDTHGLSRHGGKIAPAGFDFDRWSFDRDCDRLIRRYDLDPDDAFVLNTLITAHEQMTALIEMTQDEFDGESYDFDESDAVQGEFADLLGAVGAELADPMLAEVLLQETSGGGRHEAAALGMLAETLESKVPRSARAAARWLRAAALECLGDIAGSERELLAAESMDPDWPLTLLDLARIASDRGDVEAGLGLLHRAGVGSGHPLVSLLEAHRPVARTDVGRNDACWCGSGHKYKKCHLRGEQLALPERVGWLYGKAGQQLLSADWHPTLIAAGLRRYRHIKPFPDDLPRAALADPLVVDALLFEGGGLHDFLEQRGFLLPDDERLLAEQWLLTGRSLYDVQETIPGQCVTVRDVRTGDIIEVSERTASRALQPGQLICARVLSTGVGAEFFGGIDPVALHERDALLDLLDEVPDPMELVAFLSRRFAPPTVVDALGDPFVVCEARVRLGDPTAVAAELDECYEPSGDERAGWVDLFDGTDRVRATLDLDADILRVQTTSERRMDTVLAVLCDLDPDLLVLDDVRTPAAEMLKSADSDGPAPGLLDPTDPELLAHLEQMMLGYEQRWLDESIPALNGLTPRQAADDPTRRGDLIRLLDTFPAGAAAGHGMDADRLRAALGLN